MLGGTKRGLEVRRSGCEGREDAGSDDRRLGGMRRVLKETEWGLNQVRMLLEKTEELQAGV